MPAAPYQRTKYDAYFVSILYQLGVHVVALPARTQQSATVQGSRHAPVWRPLRHCLMPRYASARLVRARHPLLPTAATRSHPAAACPRPCPFSRQILTNALRDAGGQQCADRVDLAFKTLQAGPLVAESFFMVPGGLGFEVEGAGLPAKSNRCTGRACGGKAAPVAPHPAVSIVPAALPALPQGPLAYTPEGRQQLAAALQ